MIDLHCHSYFSDGLLSPLALVEKAYHSGIKILALTDHDTVDGIENLLKIQHGFPITLIKGIELSASWKKYDIHVLGLNLDISSPDLNHLITEQNEHRVARSLAIAEKMAALGVEQALEKAYLIAGHKRISRPHFAQVLVNEGKAKDIQTAFKRFLIRGKPAYVHKTWVSLEKAISVVKQASGMAVLAHPLKYALTRTKLHELIAEFKYHGGEGLEVISGEMTPEGIQELAGLCQRFDFFASTGSDYHGQGLSRISLGGQQQLPLNCRPIWHQWTL